MISYQKEELVSSSIISRNIGDYLNKLNKKELEKIAVMRNNKIEAVILPIETYEEIFSIDDLNEHIEISNLIQSRTTDKANRISFENVLDQMGLKIDDL
jgi:PHD/YefM family antitoxin component YafN of YafNO toxin-antitoxin module